MTDRIILIGRACGTVLAWPILLFLSAAVEVVRQAWHTVLGVWDGTLGVPDAMELRRQEDQERRERERRERDERRRQNQEAAAEAKAERDRVGQRTRTVGAIVEGMAEEGGKYADF